MSDINQRLAALSPEKRALLMQQLRSQTSSQPAHAGMQLLPRPDQLPLSFSQQGLWFLAQMDIAASAAYHMPIALRLHGPLVLAALQAACNQLLERHEVLRTSFVREGDSLSQQVGPTGQQFALQQVDLRHLKIDSAALTLSQAMQEDSTQELEQQIRAEIVQAFDFTQGPLIRARLLRLQDDDYLLLINMHHIISDGWSLAIVSAELSALYSAFVAGQAAALPSLPLPNLPLQYADYALWQRQWLSGARRDKQVTFWRDTLLGAPALLNVPTDRPRPATQSFIGGQLPVSFDAGLTRALQGLSQRHGVSLYMIVLAAWAALLTRLSGQDEVVIGTPVANRKQVELSGLIGFFVNSLALRISTAGSIASLLQHVKGRILDAQEYQELPFEQVVEVLNPVRDVSYSPVFQVMLSWQNTPENKLAMRDLTVTKESLDYGIAKFDVELNLAQEGECIVGNLSYAKALFDASTIQRHLGYLEHMLRAFASAGDGALALHSIALMQAQERAHILQGLNQTQIDFPQNLLIHELFEAQVARTPEAIALTCDAQHSLQLSYVQLSYVQLNACANKLAHQLRAQGVQPDSRVAICTERSVEMVVGLLAILKAGACYVPLDPAYPPARLEYMLQDCAPTVILTHALVAPTTQTLLQSAGVPVWELRANELLPSLATAPDAPSAEHNNLPRASLGADHLAYVIYTSGSTGQPKGVMNAHRGVVNRLQWMQHAYALTSQDVVLQKTSFSFDVSVWEFFWPLMTGARLLMARPEGHKDPAYLSQLIRAEAVTTLHFVPSMLHMFLEHEHSADCRSIVRVICSGEALAASLVQRTRQILPQANIHNLYGPTEAAVDVSYWDYYATSQAPIPALIPIGKPIANTQLYLLDAQGEPVPFGVVGEIHIGGIQVARGYMNRPELSAERFVVDPFSSNKGARMYKTGDLGRYLADGNLEYWGRNDQQVKLHGFRIELGEIEAQIASAQGVRECVVLARPDHIGSLRLVAYLVVQEGFALAQLQLQLRAYLAQQLPAHMVPATYLQLPAMPLTPNGKLDRKALPAPSMQAQQEFVAPQGERENGIAQIWAQVLKIERVGRHDNFFALGGHSLLAMSLVEHLRRAGFPCDVRALFTHPSVAALANLLSTQAQNGSAVASAVTVTVPPNLIPSQCAAITPEMLPLIALSASEIAQIVAQVPGGAANVQDIYPLAPLQEGILFHHLMEAEKDPYLMHAVLTFADRACFQRYVDALQAVINRHDILRTAVLWEGLPQAVQVVWRKAQLQVQEIAFDLAKGSLEAQLLAHLDRGACRLDVRQAPMRQLLVAAQPDSPGLVVLQLHHHLIDDNTSLRHLHDEIEAYLLGQAAQLPTPIPFRNFVAQAQLGVSKSEHEAFFSEMLGTLDTPTIAFGLSDVQGDGSNIAQAKVALDDALAQRLRACARQLGVSCASLCHLAWAQVLARLSGQDDVVFGSVMFGRMQAGDGADRALGIFINTLPIRLQLGDDNAAEAARKTHAILTALLHHEHAPLALAQRCSSVPAPAPLFTALLNYRHAQASLPDAVQIANSQRAWQGISYVSEQERTNYPLSLSVNDWGDAFELEGQVDNSIEPQRICDLMATALLRLVQALEQNATTSLRALDMLPGQERQQVLHGFNATAQAYQEDVLIHELFEAQVQATPEAIALVCEAQSFSYAQLNHAANRLARHLRSLGVVADSRVAICVDRSVEMVLGLLAILKAGGAYVPLDPAYPAARLQAMLQDSAPVVILSHAQLLSPVQALLQQAGVPLLALDQAEVAQTWAHLDADNLPRLTPQAPQLANQQLAYVIYTSGSTGAPKGVMNEHRGVVNRLQWMQAAYQLGASDAVLQKTSFSFDVSVWEFFWPLMTGAKLVMARPDGHKDPAYLVETIVAHNISTVHFVPSMLQVFLAHPAVAQCHSLKRLVCSGEALPANLVRRVQQQLPHTALHNLYGPTEAAVDVTYWDYWPQYIAATPIPDLIPIGRPVANTQIYLLDAYGHPVPAGVAGEIHIGGVQVARGYLHQAQLSAARFVADPFSALPQARMYKTGDLGRHLADGNIEYLGRNDHQIKLRGFRIELGEIEACLLQLSGVADAIVLLREDQPHEPRLVAYLVADAANFDLAAVRTHLAAHLPSHMVPAAFVVLPAMPLTPNGKLDRKALPVPDANSVQQRQYEAPQGDIEQRLALAWAEVLGRPAEQIGRQDNFFEMGGHSLSVITLNERIRKLDLQADVRSLFSATSLAHMATLTKKMVSIEL